MTDDYGPRLDALERAIADVATTIAQLSEQMSNVYDRIGVLDDQDTRAMQVLDEYGTHIALTKASTNNILEWIVGDRDGGEDGEGEVDVPAAVFPIVGTLEWLRGEVTELRIALDDR